MEGGGSPEGDPPLLLPQSPPLSLLLLSLAVPLALPLPLALLLLLLLLLLHLPLQRLSSLLLARSLVRSPFVRSPLLAPALLLRLRLVMPLLPSCVRPPALSLASSFVCVRPVSSVCGISTCKTLISIVEV